MIMRKYNNNDLSGLFSIYLDLNVEYKITNHLINN